MVQYIVARHWSSRTIYEFGGVQDMSLTGTGQPNKTGGKRRWTPWLACLSAVVLSACVGDAIMGTEDARIRPDQRPLALPPPVQSAGGNERDPNAFPPVYDPLVVPQAPQVASQPTSQPAGQTASAPAATGRPNPAPTPVLSSRPLEPVPVVGSGSAQPPAPAVQPQQPPPASPPSVAAPATTANGFWVQAGAFAVTGNAERLAERLAAIGPVDVDAITSAGRQLLRVRLGPYDSRAAANAALAQVRGAGYPEAVITR